MQYCSLGIFHPGDISYKCFFIEFIDWKSLQRPKEGFVTELQFIEFWFFTVFLFPNLTLPMSFKEKKDFLHNYSLLNSGFSFSKWHCQWISDRLAENRVRCCLSIGGTGGQLNILQFPPPPPVRLYGFVFGFF